MENHGEPVADVTVCDSGAAEVAELRRTVHMLKQKICEVRRVSGRTVTRLQLTGSRCTLLSSVSQPQGRSWYLHIRSCRLLGLASFASET